MLRIGQWRVSILVPALVCGALSASGSAAGQVPEWTLRLDLKLGSADDPPYGLTPVGGVLADANQVYVLQPQDGQIRVFSRDGTFVRALGRKGRGPGELLHPTWMGWHGSRLWVADYRLMRFTFFDVTTGDAETVPYHAPVKESYTVRGMVPRAVLDDGRLAGYPQFSARAEARGIVTDRVVVVTDADGALHDTLAVLAIDRQTGEITDGLGSNMEYRLSPLPEDGLIAIAPDGSHAVIVDRTSWDGDEPAEFEVTKVQVRGDTIFRRRVGYEPHRVPDDFFDETIAESANSPHVVNRRAYEAALREFFRMREYFPPVTRVSAGSDGTTWLAGPEVAGERIWLVLDGAGATGGRLQLPASSHVAFAGKTDCWVVESDALDIPYLVRYEIVR